MSKPNIFRRIGMRVLLWILGKECPGKIDKNAALRRPKNAPEKIQWWNWPIERVKANLDFFYGDVDEFLRRYLPDTT
jgi:hypothetical protein